MKKETRSYDMTARSAKAEATKSRIRMAAMQLYRERTIEDFTLDEVAARAGTTVQTVLRIFGSKDSLVYAALDELAAGGEPLKPTPPGDVAAFTSAIYDLYETIGDLVIQRLNDERRRPGLKASLGQGRENHRDGVKTAFAPQLQRCSGAARAQLLSMLTVLSDVYVWKLLRRDQGLSRAAAEAIVCRMITSVIKGEGSTGTHPMAQLVGRRQPSA